MTRSIWAIALLVLFTLQACTLKSAAHSSYRTKTQSNIRQIHIIVELYQLEHEAIPADHETLFKYATNQDIPSEVFKDGWEEDIIYSRINETNFHVFSVGLQNRPEEHRDQHSFYPIGFWVLAVMLLCLLLRRKKIDDEPEPNE